MCGEQFRWIVYPAYIVGSPPRVRGTVSSASMSVAQSRITPACAGNSGRSCRPWSCAKDHPRVCGEQWSLAAPAAPAAGSPPRVRGTGRSRAASSRGKRITPACAGNSVPVAGDAGYVGDHPRVCGEQLQSMLSTDTIVGSPPRVRGTDDLLLDKGRQGGITPACAGNRKQ